jgi:hypothetical protein
MDRISRGMGVMLLLATLAVSQRALADSAVAPTTQPVSDQTPQKYAQTFTNDLVATMTVDQLLGQIDYDPDSDKEKAVAKAMAIGVINCSKLEVAVRQRWGKDAEIEVIHACGDDNPDDVAKADWAVDGDRAVAQFQQDGLTPILLIRKNGQWKMDLAGYRKLEQESSDAFLEDMKEGTQKIEQLATDLAKKDAYPSGDDFIKHVKDVENPPTTSP